MVFLLIGLTFYVVGVVIIYLYHGDSHPLPTWQDKQPTGFPPNETAYNVTSLRYYGNKCESNPLVFVKSTASDRLWHIGGIKHWFHVMERLLPYVDIMWDYHGDSSCGKAKLINQSDLVQYQPSNLNGDVNGCSTCLIDSTRKRSLYVLFENGRDYEEVTPFIRYLFIVIFGAKYDNVILAYSKASSMMFVDCANTVAFNITLGDVQTIQINQYSLIDSINTCTSCLHRNSVVESSVCDDQINSACIHDCRCHNSLGDLGDEFVANGSLIVTPNIYLEWNKQSKKRKNIIRDLDLLFRFRYNAAQVCQLPEISVLRSYFDNKVLETNQQISHERISRLVSDLDSISYGNRTKHIIIYQRDRSRTISNIEALTAELADYLDKRNKISDIRYEIVQIVHDENRRPCDLIKLFRSAQIVITAHGFQGILLLFQPIRSIFIEVFPAYYFKPNLYGKIQKSINDLISSHKGLPHRHYLPLVSEPTNYAFKFMKYFNISNNFCLHNFLCRYISRKQDVVISDKDMEGVIQAINRIHGI